MEQRGLRMNGREVKSGLHVVSKRRRSTSLRRYVIAAAAGAAIALVDDLLGLWMAARGLHAELTLLDELLLAIFTGALVLVIELSHERERQRMNEKLRTIQLMNHHVRNALQSIVDSAYVHGNLHEVHTSVNRIAWALQEILPGQALEKDENSNGRGTHPPIHLRRK